MSSGERRFYVCQPNFSATPDPGSSDPLQWTLTAQAKSSNGRDVFSDPSGRAQVQLQNGWPFGVTGHREGVAVRGSVAQGTIVLFSFAPTSSAIPGYAVWKPPRTAADVRANTTQGGSAAKLFADGKRIPPALVIAPSHRLRDPALELLFEADMGRLESVADGHVSGACGFYQESGAGANDVSWAQAIGLTGKRAAIEARLRTAQILAYNGYTVAKSVIDDQPVGWILDRGHFRVGQTNLAG